MKKTGLPVTKTLSRSRGENLRQILGCTKTKPLSLEAEKSTDDKLQSTLRHNWVRTGGMGGRWRGKGGAGEGSGFTILRSPESCLCLITDKTSGDATDWVHGVLGVTHSYGVELQPSFFAENGFILPPSYIEPVGKETLSGLKILCSFIS